MELAPGARLGPYEVLAKAGEGGMGLVYRARDIRLERTVAIKVLPDLFASDPDRLARFDREAKTLASLNHPNIAQIYGTEQASATGPGQPAVWALAMEFVDGEDLAERLARGALPLDEALAVARQVADALEAAHEQGVIHRDLKPANLRVRPDGTVKVLDFGLARAVSAESSAAGTAALSPTFTSPALTRTGMIVGTAAYMAPEQARGRVVDRRADIWAFGAVLYEMLAGRPAFVGDDVSITLANVLKEDIAWDALPDDVPPPIRRLLERCLERDPKQRLRDIGEARIVLQDPAASVSGAQRPLPATPATPPRWRSLVPWAAAVVGTLGVWAAVRPAPLPSGPTIRASIALPAGLTVPQRDRAVALSPDGTMLAVVLAESATSRSQLYLRAVDRLEFRAIPGSEGATYPFWAPDGQAVGFFAANELRRFDLPDGPVRRVTTALAGRGASWGSDDRIVFAAATSAAMQEVRLYRVAAEGHEAPEAWGPPAEGGRMSRLPHILPAQGGVLFHMAGDGADGLYVLAPGETAPRKILDGASEAQYVPPGRLAFIRDGLVMVQPFDLATLTLSGRAEPVADRLVADGFRGTGHVTFPSASGRTFVYLRASPPGERQLVWMDRAGRQGATVGEADQYEGVWASPDGTRAIVAIAEKLWTIDLASGVRSPFHAGPGEGGDTVVWSPDGRRAAFRNRSGRGHLLVRPTDSRAGTLVRIGDGPENWSPTDWSPDGSQIIAHVYRGLGDIAVVAVPPDGSAEPTVLVESPAQGGRLSPNARWLAYLSTESGQMQAYVTTYPSPGRRWAVTSDGATWVGWMSATELLYADRANVLRAVAFRADAGVPVFGAREPLLGGTPAPGPGRYVDGLNRFLFAVPTGAADEPPTLVIVTNWQAPETR
jgi:eukaryotic-like serine/threonine-protein kinase